MMTQVSGTAQSPSIGTKERTSSASVAGRVIYLQVTLNAMSYYDILYREQKYRRL